MITLLIILLIVAFLLWLILANHKPDNKPDNTIIATYTQNGVIQNGSLRKGCQRPNN
jgi:hypothetical protein